jgi:hypothetical protein
MRGTELIVVGGLLALPQLTMGQTTGFTCSLASDRATYKVGEAPQFTIRIRNGTDSTVQLVKMLDASDMQWRYPYSYYEVSRIPSRQQVKAGAGIIRCGNVDGISPTDFVAVAPGKEFSPYENQSAVYTNLWVPGAGHFSKKGRYRIVYHYATDELDFRKWLGDMAWSWFDPKTGQINPSHQAQYQQLMTLFSKVPKVNLVSNELTVEFH